MAFSKQDYFDNAKRMKECKATRHVFKRIADSEFNTHKKTYWRCLVCSGTITNGNMFWYTSGFRDGIMASDAGIEIPVQRVSQNSTESDQPEVWTHYGDDEFFGRGARDVD